MYAFKKMLDTFAAAYYNVDGKGVGVGVGGVPNIRVITIV